MKIISFNFNSIRSRLQQLTAVVEKHQPEIIALQETKVQDVDFPLVAIQQLGYHALCFGQKTHYGVALLSRFEPLDVQYGYDSDGGDAKAFRPCSGLGRVQHSLTVATGAVAEQLTQLRKFVHNLLLRGALCLNLRRGRCRLNPLWIRQ